MLPRLLGTNAAILFRLVIVAVVTVFVGYLAVVINTPRITAAALFVFKTKNNNNNDDDSPLIAQ
jgi:hypothetical protein